MDRCPAKGVTCNFCHKIGHFERTCRRKRENQRGQEAVGMIRENADDTHLENSADEEAFFTIGELKRALGASGIKLDALSNEDNAFWDYGNNPLQMIGTMAITLESIGWKINARIKIIGGNRPSIIGRDLMPQLGLQLVQQSPGEQIKSINEVKEETSVQKGELDSWQTYFTKQFSNLFDRVGKIRNYKVQAEFFENLTPVQQKGRRVSISLQEKSRC